MVGSSAQGGGKVRQRQQEERGDEVSEGQKRRDSGIVWWRDGLRRCGGCEAYLEPVAFRASRGGPGDGLDGYCRACRAAADARHYVRHRKDIIARKLARRAQPYVGRDYRAYMRRYGKERQTVKRLAAELAGKGREG